MATYPIFLSPDFSYEDHLMVNEYISDLNKGMQLATKDIVKGQALSTKIISETLNKNSELLSETITYSVDQLSEHILELSNVVELGLDRLNEGIIGLRSDFNICMGKVLVQFEIMRSEINAGLGKIIHILENRRKSDAQEHFRDALKYYNDGCRFVDKPQWFDDALRHFVASVKKYERNPLAHLHIAHIYHYQKEFRNFEKALEHYRLCYTYGEADDKESAIAAQGYFYAGWLNAAVFNNLTEAIKLTNKCINLDPQLGEGHYHLSKFYALNHESAMAIKHLRYAIKDFDKSYCLKACADPDFSSVQADIKILLSELKNEAKENFRNTFERELQLSGLDLRLFSSIVESLEKFSLKVRPIIMPIKNALLDDKYFSYIDSMQDLNKLNKLHSNAEILFFKNIDLHMEEIRFLSTELNNFLDNYVPKKTEYRTELEFELKNINHLLNEIKIEFLDKAYNKIKIVFELNRERWITLEEHKRQESIAHETLIKNREKAARKLKAENEKIKRDEELRSLKQGLCLSCGGSLGFIDKLFGRKKCNRCR